MANKQQRQLQKLGLKSKNNGASTIISAISHGSGAFLKPDEAAMKNRGGKSWKTTKKHPSTMYKNGKK
jgi:hypothetical protein